MPESSVLAFGLKAFVISMRASAGSPGIVRPRASTRYSDDSSARPFTRTARSAMSSPLRKSGASGCFEAGLARTSSVLRTTVSSASRSNSSRIESTRCVGAR